MENKTRNTILFLIFFSLLVFIIFFLSKQIQEEPFNQVQLDESIVVNNLTENSYYDTVVNVGLTFLGIYNVEVQIQELSEGAKENFRSQGGDDLQAHLRELDGKYFIFIQQSNKSESIEIISHELIHLEQYHSKDLVYSDGIVNWKGTEYNFKEKTYDDRPWEKDAYAREGDLKSKIINKLFY